MKKIIISIFTVFSFALVGCGGFDNSMTKIGADINTGDYRVTVWSGGQAVKVYEIKNGYVSTEEGSDGWFFNYNGKLVRISGDVTIEEL